MKEKEQQSKLDKLNQRLRDIFLPGIKLSEHEETIMNILYKILEAKGTLKVTPRDGAYYLLNYDLHYFVKLNKNRIWIINSVDSIVRDCSPTFESFAKRAIDKSVESDVAKIEGMLFSNEMVILNKINGIIGDKEESNA